MKKKIITYAQVGDNYDTKDPVKKLAQQAALSTSKNLETAGFEEISDSRGESAFVWKQGNYFMASVIEGLGTKNLVADSMFKEVGEEYYEVIAHDTVATIINDLTTVGAKPLVLHAYWAVENNDWFQNEKRMKSFIAGWKSACDISGVTWGGGETPTLKGIIESGTIALGGSAVGIITSEKRLLMDTKLRAGDRIIFIRSSGINANGLSLARAIAKKNTKGYRAIVSNNITFGEALLTKTNIYAQLIQKLLDVGTDIHYITNITGHGLRKLMRARGEFTYNVENLFEPQPLFTFIQKEAGLSDYQMYDEYNMGQDYALFVNEKDVEETLQMITDEGFDPLLSGSVEKGEKKVILKPKNIVFTADRLDLR